MISSDDGLNEYLRVARLVEPDAAKRLEVAIREQRMGAAAAEFALSDLLMALVNCSKDLDMSRSANEHLRSVVIANPIDGLDPATRMASALGFLARSMSPGYDGPNDLEELEEFASRRVLKAGPEWSEETYQDEIGLLRASAKSARAASQERF